MVSQLRGRLPGLLLGALLATLSLLSAACSEQTFSGRTGMYRLAELESADAERGLILRNLPKDPSPDAALNVVVEGSPFTQYIYALLSGNATSCAGAAFSEPRALSIPITDALGTDGPKRLCVRGSIEGYLPQDRVTEHAWVKDSSAPGAFMIQELAPLMNAPLAGLTWDPSEGADFYELVVSPDADCALTVQQQRAASAAATFTPPLRDGGYYFCVWANDKAGNRTPASNNGLAVVIDLKAPAAFAISRPATPTREGQPEIAWSLTEEGNSYEVLLATDAACANVVERYETEDGAIKVAMPLNDGQTYHVCVTASDAAGNTTEADNQGYAFTVDQTGLNIAFVASTLPAPLAIEGKLSVAVEAQGLHEFRYKLGAAAAVDCDSESDYLPPLPAAERISESLSGLAAGRYALCAIGSDLAGNWQGDGVGKPAARFEWQWDALPPTLTLDVPPFCGPEKCKAGTPEVRGSALDPDGVLKRVLISVRRVADNRCLTSGGQFSAGCPQWLASSLLSGNFAFDVPNGAMSNNNLYEVQARAEDNAGRSSTMAASYRWDTGRPLVTAIRGAPVRPAGGTPGVEFSARVNFLKMTMTANDPETTVQSVCFTYNTTIAPGADDPCWRAIGSGTVPGSPAKAVALNGISYTIGFVPGDYVVRGYAKDVAGNVSTAGANTVLVHYNPVRPPVLSHLYVTKTAADPEPTPANTVVSGGQTVYLRWLVSTSNPSGLAAAPMSLYYTTDDKNFIEIAKGVAAGATATNCVRPTPYAGATAGCYRWALPTTLAGKYVRFRIQAEDIDQAITFGRSNALNLTSFRFLAGNTEDGLGSSALAAILMPKNAQSLVVHPSGKVFIADQRGLLFVDTFDGTLKTFIKTAVSGESRPDSAAVADARLVNPRAIALGHDNTLLILDADRIREVDLDTERVTTIIGGGAVEDDCIYDPAKPGICQSVPATSVKLRSDGLSMLAVAPNGDVFFTSEAMGKLKDLRLRRYNYANKGVTAVRFSGSKKLFNALFVKGGYAADAVPTQNIGECRANKFLVNFDETSGAANEIIILAQAAANVAGEPCWAKYVNSSEPADYIAFRQNAAGAWVLAADKHFSYMANHGGQVGVREASYVSYIQGTDGKLYATVNGIAQNNDKVYRYEHASGSWTYLAGAGSGGECPDDRQAASCEFALVGGYADAEGRLYVMDNNTVRVIQADGAVQTVAGESRTAGDTRDALSARFNEISSVGLWKPQDGDFRIVVADQKAFVIREFVDGGTIDTMAGNRVDALTSDLSLAAKGRSLTWGNDGQPAALQVDRATGDVYTIKQQGGTPHRITRATGKWEALTGLSGQGGYGPHVLAISDSKVLFGTFGYYGDINNVANGRLYQISRTPNAANPIESVLMKADWSAAGKRYTFSGPGSTPVCAANTSRMDCNGPRGSTGTLADGYYDTATSTWVFVDYNSDTNISRLVSVPVSANAANDLVQELYRVTGGRISSFAVKRQTSGATLFYCMAGKVYKTTFGGTSRQELAYPVTGMNCGNGKGSMIYDAERNGLLFNYTFNGLQGIAEFLNP